MKHKRYKTIYKYGVDEIDINKSRFIGYAKPVESEEEALEFIEKINTKHHDATHNVYAYIIGLDALTQRFSDDGEPSGTAGIPTLEVLKKEGLVNVVVVGTRYFGGTKLGAGGLIRAYTKTAKIGIDAGIIVDMVLNYIVKVRIEYTLYGSIENYLLNENYIIKDSVFDDAVNLYVYVEVDQYDHFSKKITDLSNGDALISIESQEYVAMKDGKVIK